MGDTHIAIPRVSRKLLARGICRRVYDRILEVCAPIAFTGESFRKTNAAENLKRAAQYLSV